MCRRKLQISLLFIVLLWDWTSLLASCDDDVTERYYLTDMYLSLQDINTGYENTRKILTDEELNELPAHELKATVVSQMKELECSYVYSSLYHIKVLRNIFKTRGIGFFVYKLQIKVHHGIRSLNRQFYKSVNPLCFAVESKSMMEIVYYWKYNISINTLWLCYVLNQDLARLNDIVLSARLANLTFDLNDVQDYLEYFIMRNNCSKENNYNEEYEQSIYYEDFKSLNNMSTDDKENLIVKNQEYVKDIVSVRCLDIIIDENIFVIDRIFINNVIWDDHIIGELLERYARLDKWNEIRQKMLVDYTKGLSESATLRDRIKAIALFQSKFMDLLEIIMLQLTWVHLTQLQNKQVSSAKPGSLTSRMTPKLLKDCEEYTFIRKLSKYLSRFVAYIGGSWHFNGIIDMLNRSISGENRKYKIDETELNDQINNALTTLNRLHSSFYDCKPLFMEATNHIVKPKEFTKFLTSALWKVDFGVIKSFIRFSLEFEKWTIKKDRLIDEGCKSKKED